MKILIIEDELPAARQLAKLLSALDLGKQQILETLDSVESAVQWLRTFSPPDLIFMDIQVADGLSFDIFRYFYHGIRPIRGTGLPGPCG